MHQLTLISLYGEKPKPVRDLVSKVWEAIDRSMLGRFFRPYDMRQIHGTLIEWRRFPAT